MSHFSVLVIGKDIEKQLAPFQENNMDDCPAEFMKFMACPRSGGDSQTFDSEEAAKIALGDDFDPEDAYWENPNRKWDWFKVGGRWTGYFKMKPSAIGVVGRPGLMTPAAEVGHADQALKRDIDFDGMRQAAMEKAANLFDKVVSVIGPYLEGFVPWTAMREAHAGDIDAARSAYHAQPAKVALQDCGDKNLAWITVEDFLCSREEYIKRAHDGAIETFAVVKDGQWYESGSMGWWGIVADEKDASEWNAQFAGLLDSLDAETLLTVVDCHI